MISRPSIICFTLAAILGLVDSFSLPLQNARLTTVTQNRVAVLPRSRCQHQMLPDVSSFLTAVEIFDGSSIVDPIVVSNVFWGSLKGKIVAVVIGQVLATIAFAILSSFLATQLSQVGDFVSKTLFPSKDDYDNNNKARPFIKANEIPSSSSVNKNTPTPDFGKLVICIAIDVIGSASELVPVLGEVSDVIYAPIAATILRNLYSSNIVFVLEFAEEILPFTDILPLATIW
jgi:hypothetical protein